MFSITYLGSLLFPGRFLSKLQDKEMEELEEKMEERNTKIMEMKEEMDTNETRMHS